MLVNSLSKSLKALRSHHNSARIIGFVKIEIKLGIIYKIAYTISVYTEIKLKTEGNNQQSWTVKKAEFGA